MLGHQADFWVMCRDSGLLRLAPYLVGPGPRAWPPGDSVCWINSTEKPMVPSLAPSCFESADPNMTSSESQLPTSAEGLIPLGD